MKVPSLRVRLATILLVPLILIATATGAWRYSDARATSEDLFDRTLLAAALAIFRDVAVSGGDALSPTTRDLMNATMAGTIFYHVHGPDGVHITGYATPPVPPLGVRNANETPVFFNATYRGLNVRVVRLREASNILGISGYSTVTVWHGLEQRSRFARELAVRSAVVMGILICTVTAVVWFGINLGLRPLSDLQMAISERTSSELRPIRRPLPREVMGLVATINSLFERLRHAIESKDAFIANAAHQLRNPIAGLLSMAEALENESGGSRNKNDRVADLVDAARHTSRLTDQLLAYERASSKTSFQWEAKIDVVAVVREAVERQAPGILAQGIAFEFVAPQHRIELKGDGLLIAECVTNLLDNAVKHGGAGLSRIEVAISQTAGEVHVRVADDGIGIPPQDLERAFERFGQLRPGPGSGLGLAIVAATARQHAGRVAANTDGNQFFVELVLPRPRSCAGSEP